MLYSLKFIKTKRLKQNIWAVVVLCFVVIFILNIAFSVH